MYLLKELLSKTIEMNASDLHLTVGLPPTIRSNGNLIQLGVDKLLPHDMEEFSKEILCEIQIRTLAMNFWATIEHSLKYKYEHYIPETLAVRLRRAADAAFLLDQEMSEIREDIMKAQVMYQVKSVTLRDVLDKIQELYNVGETHKAIKYQRRLDKIDNERDITEILQLKKEIDSLLQEYKNKVDD